MFDFKFIEKYIEMSEEDEFTLKDDKGFEKWFFVLDLTQDFKCDMPERIVQTDLLRNNSTDKK